MGAYGNGFYFTDSESNAGLYGNMYKVKLKIENPLKSGGSTATRDNLKKFIEAVAENEDYSIENYGTYDTEQILDMILEGNTEKDTFAVIQDVNATAIGNFAEAVELYNSTVGTTYDAIETPTETVVFNPEQIKSAEPVTYDDNGNVIPLSKRFDSTKKDIRNQVKVKITESMSDEKREEILKDKRITVKHINSLSFSVTDEKSGTKISTWDDINSLTPNMKKKFIRKIADEFGAFKGYVNDSIDLSFVYSYNNYDESYGKQKKYYESFAKIYSVFDDVINNAIGIEAHLREGYKEDPTLEKVYILISAFSDGEYIIPVKLAVKKFKDKNNSLYVTVSLDQIKKTEFSGLGTSNVIGVAQDPPSVTISIAELMEKVNPANTTLTKYFPKTMLTEEQSEALSKESNGNKNQVRISLEGLYSYHDPEVSSLVEEYLTDTKDTLKGTVIDRKAIDKKAAQILKSYKSAFNKEELINRLSRLTDLMIGQESPDFIFTEAQSTATAILGAFKKPQSDGRSPISGTVFYNRQQSEFQLRDSL